MYSVEHSQFNSLQFGTVQGKLAVRATLHDNTHRVYYGDEQIIRNLFTAVDTGAHWLYLWSDMQDSLKSF